MRRLQAGDPVSISDMADRFNHTEKDILRALCYWEKCGVLTLKLSPDRTTLQQIRLLPLSKGKRQDAGQADFFYGADHRTYFARRRTACGHDSQL